jgi:hypothetical protein
MIHSRLERGLAGLQAGMLGGIALLVVMAVFSVLDRRHWFSYPNTLGAFFYGVRSIGSGLGWHSVSGLALQLVIAGLAGALFGGIFLSADGGRRSLAFGLVWGLVVYYVSGQFYRVFKPLVLEYLPSGEALVAHLVYGVSLPWIARVAAPGRADDFGREFAADPAGPPVFEPEPPLAPPETAPPGPETVRSADAPPGPAGEDRNPQD